MKNNEILYAISNYLSLKVPNIEILINGNEEEINKSTFLISVRPLRSTSGIYDKRKITNVTITYLDKVLNQEKNLGVIDMLEGLFKSKLKVKDRYLNIENLEFVENEDCINCNFTLDFYDNNSYEFEEIEKSDLMQKFNFRKGD